MIELMTPIVMGHIEKKADLRYTVDFIEPTSASEFIGRDWWLFQTWWNPFVIITQLWLPMFINYIGEKFETSDDEGNNYNNFLILYWEQ